MSEPLELTGPERDVLLAALNAPVFDNDPVVMGLCLRLCGRRLLQRAGSVALANGWHGSPHAFVLTHQGWNLVRTERLRVPIRRAIA
jgi:hypothetical protein